MRTDMYLFNLLTDLLPAKARPYAKAIYPAVVTLVGTGVTAVNTGVLDTATIRTAIGGALLTLVTLSVPNKES